MHLRGKCSILNRVPSGNGASYDSRQKTIKDGRRKELHSLEKTQSRCLQRSFPFVSASPHGPPTVRPYRHVAPVFSSSKRRGITTASVGDLERESERNVEVTSAGKSPPSAAYIHLPFCKRRCHYCDFSIIATGDSNRDHWIENMERYVDIVCREIDATQGGQDRGPLTTVFFGGGTPSLVPPPLVGRILESLDRKFGISAESEISMEMDPGTFDEKQLKETLALGVNRVSLGVQSFDEEILKSCGRSHGVGEVRQAIALMHAHAPNWSLDLISSLPHQNMTNWTETLNAAVAAGPNHIAIYDLQVEEGTKFGRMYTPGEAPLPKDDLSAEMYCMGSRILSTAGYNHYEVSNYAKPGFESRHNQVYWRNEQYYAFGMAAASYLEGVRFTRPKKLTSYTKWVDALVSSGSSGSQEPKATKEDELLDTLMLGLRLAEGLRMAPLRDTFGGGAADEVFKGLQKHGPKYVSFLDIEGRAVEDIDNSADLVHRVRLTDPDGFLVSNDIISSLFAKLMP